MRKKILTISIFLIGITIYAGGPKSGEKSDTPIITFFTENNMELICIVDNLRIREKPDTKSAILGKMMIYETAQIMEKQSGTAGKVKDFWYKITDKNNITGWVFGDYIGYPFKKMDDNSLIYVKSDELKEKTRDFLRTRGAILYVNSESGVTNHINLEGSVPGYSRRMHILSIEQPEWNSKESGNQFSKYFRTFTPSQIIYYKNSIYGNNSIGVAGLSIETCNQEAGEYYPSSTILLVQDKGSTIAFDETIYNYFEDYLTSRITYKKLKNFILRYESGLPHMISDRDFKIIVSKLNDVEKSQLLYFYGKNPYFCYADEQTDKIRLLFNSDLQNIYPFPIGRYLKMRNVSEIDISFVKNNMNSRNIYSKKTYQKLTEIFSTIEDYPYVLHENINCPYLPIFTPEETEEARRLLKKAGYTWDEGAVTVYKWNGISYEYDKYYKSVAEYEKESK